MRKLTFIFVAGLYLTACTTTNVQRDTGEVSLKTASPTIELRAYTQKSPNLFVIKDPLVEAVEARAAGNYDVAFQKFYAAWLGAPDSEAVILALTDMALKTGRNDEAYKAIFTIVFDPKNPKADVLAAQVLSEITVGKSADTESRLNQALERAPDDPRLWSALGNYHDSQKDWRQARQSYVTALRTGGSPAGFNNNLGMSFLMEGKIQAAISKFEQATIFDPSSELYDNNRRLALALDGQFQEATKAISDSRVSDILNDAGYIAKIQNKTGQARTLFEAAIRRSHSYHAKAHENLKRLRLEKRVKQNDSRP